MRLPQEDMCQAKGVPPRSKYEDEGGPGIQGIMDVLEGFMTREADRRTFFQAQVIFWLLRATDGQARIFSLFLRPGGRYQHTPVILEVRVQLPDSFPTALADAILGGLHTHGLTGGWGPHNDRNAAVIAQRPHAEVPRSAFC